MVSFLFVCHCGCWGGGREGEAMSWESDDACFSVLEGMGIAYILLLYLVASVFF
jgi:hypothetical protein